MKIYFRNSNHDMREIFSSNEIISNNECLDKIKEFCAERSYTIPYYRTWTVPVEELNNEKATQVDVGSWSEFFFIVPPFEP